MKRISLAIVFILCLNFFPMEGKAQTMYPFWEFKINAAYNIGGTSPLPLPVEIRKIEKYYPSEFSPHIALEATRWLNEKWGISAQLTLDYKGFKVKDEVKNFHTEIKMGDGKYIGNFTGKNTTHIQNSYITIPIMASYRFSDQWTGQLGCYVAYLYHPDFKGTASEGYIRQGSPIGEKTEVEDAWFDFSKEQNRFDFGFIAAGEWEFYKDFALRGQLAWGILPIFPSDFTGLSFKMYNIYGTIGISYRL